MEIDDFVGRFRLYFAYDGGYNGIHLICPWCEPKWHYEMPWEGEFSDVLANLDKHMTAEHRG